MRTKKLKYRWLKDRLPAPDSKRLVLITGARQTGKTTLANLKYPELNYINLDDPAAREKVASVSAQGWANTVGKVVLDEAQKSPEVFEKIKFAYDAGKVAFSVLLGSSQILLLKKVRESLAGRIFIYELWPLLLSELAAKDAETAPNKPLLEAIIQNEQSLDTLLAGLPSVTFGEQAEAQNQALQHMLMWGGMPELLTLTENEKSEWLRSYEYTYLERDLQDLARLDDLEPFKTFQRILALRSGQLLSYSELARDSQVGITTARRYYEYLRLSYQIIVLKPFYRNLTSTLVKTPKLYWTDVGLLRQLSGYWGPANGAVFETLVVGEIYKWINTSGGKGELYFYRTRSGLEVDLLLKTQHGLYGIEIKSRKKADRFDAAPLVRLANALGKEWLGGMIVYSGEQMEKIAEPGIWSMPVSRLLA